VFGNSAITPFLGGKWVWARNRENPSEPTTPLPSLQYEKAQESQVRGNFCWLRFYDSLYLVAPDEKSENLSQSYLVAPD